MSQTMGNVVPVRPRSFKTLLAATAVAISLVVGAAGSPANAFTVEVTNEPIVLEVCCLRGNPITLEIGLPAGAELTHGEVIALLEATSQFIADREAFILAKEEALVGEVIDIFDEIERALRDLLEDVVIPFLEEVLDDTIGLVVLVKENVFNVCLESQDALDAVVCTDAE